MALSGGGDSLALMLIAADWARRAGRRLLAITVDHGLNPDSGSWSRRCEAAARAAGADWIETFWKGAKPATGLPAAARRARHQLVAEAARDAGARVVLFGHTGDDIAESDWMRAEGSTLGALREWAPSPVWPEGRELMLLRPMLGERRAVLREWLRARGSDWIEDPANGDARFGRSRARMALSSFPVCEELSARERPRWGGPVAVPDGSALRAPSPLSLGEGFERVGEGLGSTLLCAAGHDRLPRPERLATLAARLASGDDFTATLAGAQIQSVAGRVVVGRAAGELRRRPLLPLPLTPGRAAVWDGRYEITVLHPGHSVVPAMDRLARLSPSDRAIVNTAPVWARGALPVLIRDDGGAPVLAWRRAEVRALAPRRLKLALVGHADETTHERDLRSPVHGETSPPDLFSTPTERHPAAPAYPARGNIDEPA